MARNLAVSVSDPAGVLQHEIPSLREASPTHFTRLLGFLYICTG